MKKWDLSILVSLCAVVAGGGMAGSPAASPLLSAETYTSIIPSSHLLAASVDTVFVYAGTPAVGPALAYPDAAPSREAAPARGARARGQTAAASSSSGAPEKAPSDGDRAGNEAPPERRPGVNTSGDGAITVLLSGPGPLEAEPGKIITARFTVTNNTDRAAALREMVTRPEGWSRVASADPNITLVPGGVAMRLVTLHVPLNCPAGVYDVSYEVMEPAAPARGSRGGFSVTVLPQLELTSHIMTAPRTVVAGSEFTAQVSLTNRGNTRAVTTVRATVRPDYESRVEPGDILIPSGETRSVRVRVKTDRQLQQRVLCTVVLRATTADEAGRTTAIEEVITVDVIPRVTRLTDPYYRLPSWVKVSVAADGKAAGGQLEISGSGPVAGDTGRNLSYVLRQASTPSIGRYASWNEYWASYRGRHIEVDVGDKVYSLSPLLQRFNYGQGAGGRVSLYRFAAGGYYAGERSDEPDRREVAGFVAFTPGPDVSIRANVIEKEADIAVYDEGSRHFLASLQGRYAPRPGTDFELEYGVGNEQGGDNHGYRLWAGGVFRSSLYYSLEMVHAGPRFYGYYTDTDFALGTLQFPVRPGVTLRLFYRHNANNLSLDPEKLTANRERNIMAGVSYMLGPSVRLLVDLQDFTRRDRLDSPMYDFGERTVKVSAGYSLSMYSVYASAEAGYLHDSLHDRRAALNRYSLSGSFRPGQRQSYNVYGSFGHSKYSEEPRRSDNLGVAGRWQVTRDLDMMLDYHMSGSPSLADNTYRILTHSLDYMLPNRHMLTLRTSFWGGRGEGRSDMTVLLSYSIPAPIPLGRKNTVGTVRGRVYDAEDPRQPGVANVIITADGAAAVTDGRGNFEFPSLGPGVYSLQVDARSIGLGRVTEGKSPFVVIVEGGRTARVDIGVVRSCSISGEVLMFDLGPGGSPVDDAGTPDGDAVGRDAGDAPAGGGPVLVGLGRGRKMPGGARGLPDVLVEVTNGEYYLTQYTTSGGEFSFTGLRPGRWTVRIYPEDLPHYYFVETEERPADLAAGDQSRMVFRILPRQRRINIMDEGDIKLERR